MDNADLSLHQAPLRADLDSRVKTVVVLNDFTHVQGGASKVAIDEAVALAEAGLTVFFVGAGGPIADQLARAPLTTICLDQPELLDVGRHPGVALQAMWNRAAHRRMAALLATLDPATTIVHLHGYVKALSTSPVAAARARGFRVICTLHDFFSACPNGAFFDYVRVEPCKLRALSVACVTAQCDKRHRAHKLFRVAKTSVQRSLAGFPAKVTDYIALSHFSTEKLRPYLPDDARFHPLENIIAVERHPPVVVAENRSLVCIGRLDEEKGVRLLAEAAGALGLPVVFVGDGPLRAALEGMPCVTVAGWVSPAEVVAHLQQARCLVFPSLWYETYGLTVAEAAARGVPAVVSDVSAPAERIVDGVTGWHFRSGDSASLRAALLRTRDDAAVAAAGAATYDRYWRAPPTALAHIRALTGIYATVLAG
jgi:glycosyltransferase involved in cell wall biosynthesis